MWAHQDQVVDTYHMRNLPMPNGYSVFVLGPVWEEWSEDPVQCAHEEHSRLWRALFGASCQSNGLFSRDAVGVRVDVGSDEFSCNVVCEARMERRVEKHLQDCALAHPVKRFGLFGEIETENCEWLFPFLETSVRWCRVNIASAGCLVRRNPS